MKKYLLVIVDEDSWEEFKAKIPPGMNIDTALETLYKNAKEEDFDARRK